MRPVVVTTAPEKVGHLVGPHAERLHHLEGLPPSGPQWGEEEGARLALFDAPVEPVGLPQVARRDDAAPGPHGDVPVRLYTPATLSAPDAQGRHPVIVWIHGGAFVGGDLDMPEADHTAARLADLTGQPVVSVFYRLCSGGVHHPVPHDDAWAAYLWARAGSHGLHGRDTDQAPAGVFLAYPVVHRRLPAPSAELEAAVGTLPPALAPGADDDWLMDNYLGPAGLPASHPGYALPGEEAELAGYPRTLRRELRAGRPAGLRGGPDRPAGGGRGRRRAAHRARRGSRPPQRPWPAGCHAHLRALRRLHRRRHRLTGPARPRGRWGIRERKESCGWRSVHISRLWARAWAPARRHGRGIGVIATTGCLGRTVRPAAGHESREKRSRWPLERLDD